MRIYIHREGQIEADAIETGADVVIADAFEIANGDVVLLEDADDEVDVSLTFEQAGIVDHAHAFHGRRKAVEVIVHYNGERRDRRFAQSARVERVFRWAVGKHGFGLGKEDAAEHTLARASDNSVPPADAHVGSLDDATPAHLELQLIPKHRYEG